jgi:hypothetical protein
MLDKNGNVERGEGEVEKKRVERMKRMKRKRNGGGTEGAKGERVQ